MDFSHVSFVGCPTAACRYLTVKSMLGSLYTLWTYLSVLVWLKICLMRSWLYLVVCTLYTLLLLATFNGWSRMSVSILRLLGISTCGTRQSPVLGHCHPLSTDSSVTMICVVCAL